ncbi:hypothetical protein MCOR02_005510 [Pyricularia oryzae]|uniref:Uncharacterized protein n=1 Tax=Pyricularia oryzae TaxID=318829 RepID=A0A4V1C7E3_PYROR|nr:hypothetical protein MCOR02_005510 [Pyricularia oryzae]QBZ63088.1 hypothetical protein PoMZ_11981 [Pyricularia oryzae]
MVHAQKEAGKGRTGCKGRRMAERACFSPSLLVSNPCCQVGADLLRICAWYPFRRLALIGFGICVGGAQNLKAELIDPIWLAPCWRLRQGELAFMRDGYVCLAANSVKSILLAGEHFCLGFLFILKLSGRAST